MINRGGKAVTGLPTLVEHKLSLRAGSSDEFERWRRCFVGLQRGEWAAEVSERLASVRSRR